jgi:hypothetical protein
MTVKTKPVERRSPTEFVEGEKALRNFTDTMRGLFRVRKADIEESPRSTHRRKTKKAGS